MFRTCEIDVAEISSDGKKATPRDAGPVARDFVSPPGCVRTTRALGPHLRACPLASGGCSSLVGPHSQRLVAKAGPRVPVQCPCHLIPCPPCFSVASVLRARVSHGGTHPAFHCFTTFVLATGILKRERCPLHLHSWLPRETWRLWAALLPAGGACAGLAPDASACLALVGARVHELGCR